MPTTHTLPNSSAHAKENPVCAKPDRPGRNNGRLLSGCPSAVRKPRNAGTGDVHDEHFLAYSRQQFQTKKQAKDWLRDWILRNTRKDGKRRKSGERAVMLFLLEKVGWDANAGNFVMCWPKRKTIARACGIKERSLRKIMAKLEARGLIVRVYQYWPNGAQMYNNYFFAPLTEIGPPPSTEIGPPPLRKLDPPRTHNKNLKQKEYIGMDSQNLETSKATNKSTHKTESLQLETAQEDNEDSTVQGSTKQYSRLHKTLPRATAEAEKQLHSKINWNDPDLIWLLTGLNRYSIYSRRAVTNALVYTIEIVDYLKSINGSWKDGPGYYGIKLRQLLEGFDPTTHIPVTPAKRDQVRERGMSRADIQKEINARLLKAG